MDILGLTKINGVIKGVNLSSVSAPSGRLIHLDFDGAYRIYETSDTQQAGGISLASGNYANPRYFDTSLNDVIYNNQSGTSYTITALDRGKTVSMNNAGANTVTIDTNSNHDCPINMVCLIAQDGTGQTTLNSVAGVTVNGQSGDLFSYEFDAQYKAISIEQKTLNNWIVRGV